jgi:hypothetical protein
MNRVISAAIFGLALLGSLCVADPEAEFWDQPDLQERTAAVSGGELRFVPLEEASGMHAHQNSIRILEASLADGWVALEQCHEDLDPVAATQIVFHPERIRALELVSSNGIGQARVEGHTVQLEDVSPGASLCLRAERRALLNLGGGRFRLRIGPYMRRFLDGYYAMRLFLAVEYPTALLKPAGHLPLGQAGFEPREGPGQIELETAFEGRLMVCLDFCVRDASDCPVTAGPCSED